MSENVFETKLCMLSDDNFASRNQESFEQALKVLAKYEKASGSEINYEKKTKWLFIGRLKGSRQSADNRMAKRKRTKDKNDLQDTTQKTKDRSTRAPLKPGVNLSDPEA